MRAFTLLMILVNVGLLGWTRWIAPPYTPTLPRAVPADAVKLRVVRQGQERPQRMAPAPASVDQGRQSEADRGAEAGDPSPPQSLPAPDQPAAPRLAGTQLILDAGAAEGVCAAVGPFLDAQEVEAVIAALRDAGIPAGRRTVQEDVFAGSAVLIPPLGSREEARAMAERLRAAGIADLYIEPSGPLRDAISLGLFSDADRAARHAERLQSLGFAAQVRDRTRTEEAYFVDFEVPPGAQVDLSRFEAPGRRLGNGQCDSLTVAASD